MEHLNALGIWIASLGAFLLGIQKLGEWAIPKIRSLGSASDRAALERVISHYREIEEMLSAGIVPEPRRWEDLKNLEEPWGMLAHESIEELRRQGGAIVPTLARLRAFASHQSEVLVDARARSSQAAVQAVACSGLVLLFGLALYFLLPGIEPNAGLWCAACAVALALSGFGAKWVLAIAANARWAGIPEPHRNALLGVQCAGERFTALLRAGNPADIAWSRCCEWLSRKHPLLASQWGHSLWGLTGGNETSAGLSLPPSLRPLLDLGNALRKSAQVSLMEGRPCLERCEAALSAFRCEMKSRTDRELSVLPTKALKPLFLCVAPALLGLLALGLWLAFVDQLGSMNGI